MERITIEGENYSLGYQNKVLVGWKYKTVIFLEGTYEPLTFQKIVIKLLNIKTTYD